MPFFPCRGYGWYSRHGRRTDMPRCAAVLRTCSHITVKVCSLMKRKLELYLIDFSITAGVYFAVCLLIFLWNGADPGLARLAAEALFAAVFYCAFAALCKVNTVIWRYSSEKDYLYIFCVSLLSGLCSFLVFRLLPGSAVSVLYSLIALVLCSCALTFSRIVYRILVTRRVSRDEENGKRLLIIGAGNAGSRMLNEIRMAPNCTLKPIGFADDDVQKLNRRIGGIPVLGTVAGIQDICRDKAIDLIYIAIPSITNERRSQILSECLKTDCAVKTLPIVPEINDSRNLIGSLRDITPEELLGREPIQVADEDILGFISGKNVLITGGGGSIGSEICRQIAAKAPRRLVIVDVYENNAYAIQQELICRYGDSLNLEVYITTVCDFGKLNAIFAKETPDIVIHAAAHKHVPLMEVVPDEAVKNNIFGTLNTVHAAIDNKVGRMVLISTDKAVNPTNIMGATKRVCEMIIQYANTLTKDTTFTAVRFGNVLGSNGSVIPLFKNQIESRHDVTVTHPDMIRYFMTISEASQLVLTASAMAKGGEIFVLDMGEPVKIDDLAKNMIRLSGLTLGKDINIKYIGLRPGEKLFEELLLSEEGTQKTVNKKIYIGKTIPMDYRVFEKQLEELRGVAESGDSRLVEEELMKMVPTFHRRQSHAASDAARPSARVSARQAPSVAAAMMQ